MKKVFITPEEALEAYGITPDKFISSSDYLAVVKAMEEFSNGQLVEFQRQQSKEEGY